MLQRINRFYMIFHFLMIFFVCGIVLLTRYFPPYSNLLRHLSAEGGLFEWGSFLIAFAISGFAWQVYFFSSKKNFFSKTRRYFILAVGIGSLLVAMEEISWGQRILGFESNDFFTSNNYQQETNLHNLVSGEYVNLVIYSLIYIFFIYLPLIMHFNRESDRNSSSIRSKLPNYLPSVHNILMFCFASGLQAYFVPRTLADTIFLWLGLLIIMALFISRKNYRTKFLIIHLVLVTVACIIFAISYRIFEYNNMQYEIREFVVSYAFLYWFFNRITTIKNQVAPR